VFNPKNMAARSNYLSGPPPNTHTHATAPSTAMTPEERARQQINALLQQSGWIVQDRSRTNFAAGLGVAIRDAVLNRVNG
jgi:hypothetical protein